MNVDPAQCFKCKGRNCPKYCGTPYCSFCHRAFSAQHKKKIEVQDFDAAAPTVFVGRYGYPKVNVGILSPPGEHERAWEYDAPKHWKQQGTPIPEIMFLRSSLVNARFQASVKKPGGRLTETMQEVAMASKPVDLEVNLKERAQSQLSVKTTAAPFGPNAPARQVALTSNPSVSKKVERVVDDDIKATTGMSILHQKGFGEQSMTKLLSAGLLGRDKKMVPTRWSITAVDDTIGKELWKQVRDYQQLGWRAYFGSYLGNYYLILTFPHYWSYELFEMYAPSFPSSGYMTDYEGFHGRKSYADDTAGGYYTVRMAILEHLSGIKRQGAVLALRFITEEYTTPLGVWVTREAARNAMNNEPLEFGSQELLLRYAKALCKKKFGCDIALLLRKSKLLSGLEQQSLEQY